MTDPTASEAQTGFHLGATPWLDTGAGPAEVLAEQAATAERLGYRSFWLPESHFTGRGAVPAPLLRLAAVAARTRRIRLATTSFLLPVRHPLHAAAEVAELDQLSQGRVILGVGRGFRAALFRAFGVAAREKRDLFESALEVMCRAWRGEPVLASDDSSEAGAAEPVVLSPLPVQRPHPPIWVAGFGPKAVAQAGRLGLPYLASPIESFDHLVENYARHREALAEAGHDVELPVPVMRTVFASEDPRCLARAHAALGAQASALATAPLQSLRRHAVSAVDDWAIVGEPARVADAVSRLREKLGTTHLIVRPHVPGVEPEAVAESLERIAELFA